MAVSLTLTQAELAEVLAFKPLISPTGLPFGYDLSDYAGYCPIDDWFHDHRQRFILDIATLPRQPHAMNAGPWDSGIYFLFRGDELRYVGQSKYIKQRLNRHGYPPPKTFDHVEWFTDYACIWVPQMFLDSVESYYLHKYDPPINVKLPPAYGPACDYL